MKICEICISSLFYSLKNILGMMFFPNWFGIWFQGSLWCNKWGWIGGFGGQCPSRSQSLDYFTSNQGHAPKEFLFNEYNVWQTKNGKLFFEGEEENLTFLLFLSRKRPYAAASSQDFDTRPRPRTSSCGSEANDNIFIELFSKFLPLLWIVIWPIS